MLSQFECSQDIKTYLKEVGIIFDIQTDYFKQKLNSLELSIGQADRGKKVESIGDQMKYYFDSVQLLKDELPDVAPHNIDAICDMLMAPDILLYWNLQSPDFQNKLKSLLQESKDTESIFQALMSISDTLTKKNRSDALQAGVSGNQILDSSISCQQLVSESVQKLVDLIKPSSGIKILAPVNEADNSADIIIKAAANDLKSSDINHVMFALGTVNPRHWYWVTISKTVNQGAPYAVEVFDPYCTESEYVYQLLESWLSKSGNDIKPIAKTPFVNNGMIVPQRDGYSCGYYAAAYAHLKVQQLDDQALCNQDMINALRSHGNNYGYLRDMCLYAVNPSKCLPPSEDANYSNQLNTYFWSNQETSSRVWNFRGGQRAFYSTLFVEAAIVGLSFIPTIKALLSTSIPVLSSVGIPPLFLIMFIAAVATIYVSNRYEPIVIDTSNRLNSFAV